MGYSEYHLGLRGYRGFSPSTILVQIQKLPQRPEVPKYFSTPESMVEICPPLDLTVDIFFHFTHGLDLKKRGSQT
jgi:hypothetical protein